LAGIGHRPRAGLVREDVMSRRESLSATTRIQGPRAWLVARLNRAAAAGRDAGMTTAEYAVGTVAACGFAGVLFKVITSAAVFNAVKQMVLRAFQFAF
jgi:hypothetical protein